MTLPKLGHLPDAPLGVAVSGGGDSVALLMLMHRAGYSVSVATVDHRLRPESAQEAQDVAQLCAEFGIAHATLVWQHSDDFGNLQQAARDARHQLLTGWAAQNGLANIVLGHTQDDQAETFLLRLARGSGVDGLAAMAVSHNAFGLTWHRPLLQVRREELRGYLRGLGVGWAEDPGNDDLKYDRIKARQALEILAPMGIDVAGLAKTADRMRQARNALETATVQLARKCVEVRDTGEVQITAASFLADEPEVQLRVLAAVLCWVSGATYRPRLRALQRLLHSKSSTTALHGCIISANDKYLTINREVAATPAEQMVQPLWDGRWQVSGPVVAGDRIRALGKDGLPKCPGWRGLEVSRAALLASPSIWRDGDLIAAPLAKFGDKWAVNLAGATKGFYDRLITH